MIPIQFNVTFEREDFELSNGEKVCRRRKKNGKYTHKQKKINSIVNKTYITISMVF